MKEEPTSEDIAKAIYTMKLGEVYKAYNFIYMRVPGGWLFTNTTSTTPVFIPFNNEFMKWE